MYNLEYMIKKSIAAFMPTYNHIWYCYAQKRQNSKLLAWRYAVFGILKIRLSKKVPIKLRTLVRSRALSADFYDYKAEGYKSKTGLDFIDETYSGEKYF